MAPPLRSVVWLKRDLRLEDHRPFLEATKAGPFLPLYILEPDLWAQPDASPRQLRFILESLTALKAELATYGLPLLVLQGEAVQTLSGLHRAIPFQHLYAHEETGNAWTFQRDIHVRAWAQEMGVHFSEYQQFGVVRPLRNRDHWADLWHGYMLAPQCASRAHIEKATPAATYPLPAASLESAGLTPLDLTTLKMDALNQQLFSAGTLAEDQGQPHLAAGTAVGKQVLESFLQNRGINYNRHISSPLLSIKSGSRLSPHITYGTLSLRSIFQQTLLQKKAYAQDPDPAAKGFVFALKSFMSRLRWHCHFMQKLEDQPNIETHCLHPAYDDIRSYANIEEKLLAWQTGQTGYPLVDACMRSLRATGWINFRMRAMLVSFASYHLWLPWQAFAEFLARQFIDYEPGIHYSQIQMQSGTTGMNAIRIYNPIKQSLDQDPTGQFIKAWIPELRALPQSVIHTPWKSLPHPAYPAPLVEEASARKSASAKIYGARKGEIDGVEKKAITKELLKKHGSRRRAPTAERGKKKPPAKQEGHQLSFDF